MTREEAYRRCVRTEFARDQALRRAGVGCIFLEAEPRCAMRFGLTEAERRAAWSSFGAEPVVEEAAAPAATAVAQPEPLPAALVGVAMGGLSLVVGSFLFALIAPRQDLGVGMLYAIGPSIAAGVVAAHIHKTDPMLSAKIIGTTTGMKVRPVPAEQPTAAARGE